MAYNFQTFGNPITEAFYELSVDSGNSIPGLSQSEMEQWANRFSKIFIEKCKLNSQDATYGLVSLDDKDIATAAIAGAVSLALNSVTGMSSTGLVVIEGRPYTYSAINSLTLTISALDRAYSAGEGVQVGYALPTNFGKPRYLTIEGARYELQKWGTVEKITGRTFAIVNDFLILPEDLGANQNVVLHYYKKATNTLTESDTSEIYQMWDSYVIFRLVARGYRLLQDLTQAREYEQMAEEVLAAAKHQAAEADLSPHRGFVPGF